MFKSKDLALLRDVTNTNKNRTNMRWNSNAKHILEVDEASYFRTLNEKQIIPQKQVIEVTDRMDAMKQSMGEYFGSRSPAVSDMFASGDLKKVAISHKEDDDIAVKKTHTTPIGNNCLFKPLKDKQGKILYATPTDIGKSNNTKNEIDTFFNRLLHKKNQNKTDGNGVSAENKTKDRNSKDSKAYNVTNIHIAKLKHIQRFYQFKVKPSHKEKVKSIILKYIDDCLINNGQKGKLLAITRNEETNDCTVLIMFDSPLYRYKNDSDYWINNFLRYPKVQNMLDLTTKPSFTALGK